MSISAGLSYWDAFLPGLLIAALAIAVLPWVNRNNSIVRVCALGLGIILGWRYMLWRVFETIPPVDKPLDFAFGVVFTGIEFLAMIGSTASWIFLMRIRSRSGDADRNVKLLEALPQKPKVDLLICTYNEEADILERTIIGSLGMTYPNYRIWVCDDGRRAWLKELCEKYDVGYLTRPDNKHAKAGNINAALKVLSNLDEPPDFISILDADFVPLPEFLTRALSLMGESDVGVVQTPQHFFNPDPVQSNLSIARVWPDEQRVFFDVVMASKDAWNAAFCCGTSSVIRFSALQGIGGFPTDSVTEDYLVSLRLRQKGFRTVYLNEVLSLGLAPEGLAEYATQRSRWSLGFVQICRGPSGPLKFGNKLLFVDRIMLLETFLYWSATHMFRILGIIIPALYLLFDIQAVHASIISAIFHIFPFFVVQSAVFPWLTQGRSVPLMSDLYQLLCATEVLKSVTAGVLRPKGQKFKVTAKGGDRSQKFVQWPMLRIFLALLFISLFGIANAFLFDDTRPLAESSALALFWSWWNIIILMLACFVCIEQQQRRRGDRFETGETINVGANGSEHLYQASDISVSGLHLTGAPPAPVGSVVRLRIGELTVDGEIVRLTETGFGVRFEPTLQNRIALTRYVFSGRYSGTVKSIKPGQVALAVTSRLLR
jgi:cellulose synthase (UDP-forming)